jgi:hypothetical protein
LQREAGTQTAKRSHRILVLALKLQSGRLVGHYRNG